MNKFFIAIFLCLTLIVTASAQSRSNTIVLPVGTELQVRVNESLTSETAQPGDQFTGTLVNSIEDESGRVLFGRGAYVNGRVISAKPSGRLSDSGELVLSINSIRSSTQTASLTVGTLTLTGDSHTASNTAKIGGGAVLGAIIGGIAGGGKGAAIGAGAGTAAGTAGAAATGKKNAKVDSESVLRFVTSTDSNVIAYSPDTARQNDSPLQTQNQTQNQAQPQSQMPTRDEPPPVLRRRENTNNTNTSSNSNNSTNYPNDNSASNNTITTANSCAACVNATASVTAFSARDRRVINSCIAENPDNTAATQRPATNEAPLQRNNTLPFTVQRRAKSLPLACERQLPAISNDMERVIYNRQVMLIDSNNRILDIFDLTQR
jgi:uncharacterized protein YcfJ